VEIADAEHMDLIDPESAAWVTVLECVIHMIQEEAAWCRHECDVWPFSHHSR
jgi:hypothetical protein